MQVNSQFIQQLPTVELHGKSYLANNGDNNKAPTNHLRNIGVASGLSISTGLTGISAIGLAGACGADISLKSVGTAIASNVKAWAGTAVSTVGAAGVGLYASAAAMLAVNLVATGRGLAAHKPRVLPPAILQAIIKDCRLIKFDGSERPTLQYRANNFHEKMNSYNLRNQVVYKTAFFRKVTVHDFIKQANKEIKKFDYTGIELANVSKKYTNLLEDSIYNKMNKDLTTKHRINQVTALTSSIGAWTAAGAATGSFVPMLGNLAGAVTGLAIGLTKGSVELGLLERNHRNVLEQVNVFRPVEEAKVEVNEAAEPEVEVPTVAEPEAKPDGHFSSAHTSDYYEVEETSHELDTPRPAAHRPASTDSRLSEEAVPPHSGPLPPASAFL